MISEYQCKLCGASYGLASLLNAHIASAHGILTDVNDAPLIEWQSVNRTDGLWSAEQIIDTAHRHDPLYPKNMLKRIEELESRITALEAENEQLKAGK